MSYKICATFDAGDQFARDYASALQYPLYIPYIGTFSDGELQVQLSADYVWSESEVVLIQPTTPEPNDILMRALLFVHAVKAQGAQKCTWIVPYCAYARQCKDSSGSYPGPMSLIARLLEAAGVDEIVIIEPHQPEVMSYFSIAAKNMSVLNDIVASIKGLGDTGDGMCVVAPDKGGATRAHEIARILDLPVVEVIKERLPTGDIRIQGVHGYFGYKRAIVIDDIIDTGGTALAVARVLHDLGVEDVIGYFVHAVFSRGIDTVLRHGLYKKIYVSPTIALPPKKTGSTHESAITVFPLKNLLMSI